MKGFFAKDKEVVTEDYDVCALPLAAIGTNDKFHIQSVHAELIYLEECKTCDRENRRPTSQRGTYIDAMQSLWAETHTQVNDSHRHSPLQYPVSYTYSIRRDAEVCPLLASIKSIKISCSSPVV